LTTIFYDRDADPAALAGKTVAVIGYGSQGHAHALNLKDSGVKVVVGLHRQSRRWDKVGQDGLEVMAVDEATQLADVIMILVPDELQAALYKEEIGPFLSKAKPSRLLMGSTSISARLLPRRHGCFMVAPKGRDIWFGVCIRRDSAFLLYWLCIRMPKGTAGKSGWLMLGHWGPQELESLRRPSQKRPETDLFGEQAVLCGGVTALIQAGFETLVEAGYQAEIAYFECLHELKLIVDLIYEGGIGRMRYSVSNTAEYGDMTRGPRIIDDRTKMEMKKILAEIRSGEFAREWILENLAGRPGFKALERMGTEHPIEAVGERLGQ